MPTLTHPIPNATAAATAAPGPALDPDRMVTDAQGLLALLPLTEEGPGMLPNREWHTAHDRGLLEASEVAALEDANTLIIEICPHTI